MNEFTEVAQDMRSFFENINKEIKEVEEILEEGNIGIRFTHLSTDEHIDYVFSWEKAFGKSQLMLEIYNPHKNIPRIYKPFREFDIKTKIENMSRMYKFIELYKEYLVSILNNYKELKEEYANR